MENDYNKIITYTTQVRVRYAETDKMGIVNNVTYLEYFEVGRGELMRSYGHPYRKYEDAGYLLPLIEAHLNYKSSAYYDDLLDVKCSMEYAYKPTLKFNYELYCNGKLLVTGWTLHTFLSKENMKPIRPPKMFVDDMENVLKRLNI
jgi:acyl-CoA thioester hydrolase